MEESTFEWENVHEQNHWWFVTRRHLFTSQIQRLGLPQNAKILDIGTSTGTNLRMLRDMGFTDVTGLDMSETAIQFCSEKGFDNVILGDITNMPFPDNSFDFVIASDILEHVDDETKPLSEIKRVLKPTKAVLISVPAFQCLWSLQDELGNHKRRYLKTYLIDKLCSNGLTVQPRDCFYFNFLLFLPIFLIRTLMNSIKKIKHDAFSTIRNEGELNTYYLNKILKHIFMADIYIAQRIQIPFGISIFAMCHTICCDNSTYSSIESVDNPPEKK